MDRVERLYLLANAKIRNYRVPALRRRVVDGSHSEVQVQIHGHQLRVCNLRDEGQVGAEECECHRTGERS
jgi:hypothetical protein